MMHHHISAALADEHRKTLLAQAEAAGLAKKARLHRQSAIRSRAAVTAGVVAIAAPLGGTAAAVVVAASAGSQSAVHLGTAPPGTIYDPAQLATKYHAAQPGSKYNGIQLTDLFNLAAPGPKYDV